MFRFFKNNDDLKKSLYLLAVIIISILFYKYIENVKVSAFIPIILSVLAPFIYGAIIAYLLNIGTRAIENHIFTHIKYFCTDDPVVKRRERVLSISLAFIILIGAVIAIISYIIPEIMSSAQNIINIAIGIDYTKLRRMVDNFLIYHNIVLGSEAYNSLMSTIDSIVQTFTEWLKYLPNMIWSIASHAMSIASSVLNVIMGLIIAFYFLVDKEKVIDIGKKIVRCILPVKAAGITIHTVKSINDTFNSFFTGKTLDSLIIGFIFFMGALILDLPYSLLFAIIIAVTNMIPYFGPFIGAVPVVSLTLLVSPVKSIWVAIFILILQQLDGMIIGPKILGSSIGLKPIGVIFAIIVGGAIAGPLGMFFGVPIFAFLFKTLFDLIDKQYSRKYPAEEEQIDEQSQES